MKLSELSGIIRSATGDIQFVIVYDLSSNRDIETGCSAEYAMKHYGDHEVQRLQAEGDSLVLSIATA